MKEWNWKRHQEVWDHDVKRLFLFPKSHQRLWVHSISSYLFAELFRRLSTCSLTWRNINLDRVYFSLSGGKEFSAHLALNSSGNLLFIKTAWFENPARSAYFFAAPATELWKRDISNASERVFPGCFSDFFGADFHRKRGVLVRKNSLAPSQIVSSQRRATRSDVSFKTKQSECLVTVEL